MTWTFDGSTPRFDSGSATLDGSTGSSVATGSAAITEGADACAGIGGVAGTGAATIAEGHDTVTAAGTATAGIPPYWAAAVGLAVLSTTATTALLSWNAATSSVSTVAGYKLSLTPSGGGTVYLDTMSVGLTYTLAGLASGTSYSVAIAAYDALGTISSYQDAQPFSTLGTSGGRMLPQYVFGPGVVWATQNTTASGVAVSNPPPILVAALQDLSIDMSADVKELYGTNSFAIAIGRGKQKMGFKLKNAQINGALWNAMFFGQTLTSGIYTDYYDTTGSVVPASPYQVTPVTAYTANLPSGATFGYDLGVRDVNNLPLQRVASAPATRQYSLSAGVYTFASADVGVTYYISFNYTATSTVAQKLAIANLPMGYAPTFQLDLIIPYQGNVLSATFPNCMTTSLKLATKLDDFAYPELDISAFAPGAAGVGTLTFSQ